MAKRYTDTTIWKKQRWFKKLNPYHKLAWKYITDTCDHAGILKIDFSEFIDDLGIEEFDIPEFINACNVEFDKENGKKVYRERIKLVQKNVFWITGFIKFQYENKDFLINPSIPAVYSALTILNGYGTLKEGLDKGYFTLSKPYNKGMLTTKDKDIDKDIKPKEDESVREETKSDKIFLIPEMVRVYQKSNPGYPASADKDFKPLGEIASFIAVQEKLPKDPTQSPGIVIKKWEELCTTIVAENFYKTKPLSTISKQIQEIYQINQNGGSKINNGSFKKTNTGKHQIKGTGGY